jgi:hypothetical protein
LAEEVLFDIAWGRFGITLWLLWFVVVINIIRRYIADSFMVSQLELFGGEGRRQRTAVSVNTKKGQIPLGLAE